MCVVRSVLQCKVIVDRTVYIIIRKGWVQRSQVAAMEVEVSTTSVTIIGGNHLNNWWALLALALVVATAGGNILVCLAITWERRLQNVTNYFLMSLAITDLMVAVLVMPLGILTLVRGKCKLCLQVTTRPFIHHSFTDYTIYLC